MPKITLELENENQAKSLISLLMRAEAQVDDTLYSYAQKQNVKEEIESFIGLIGEAMDNVAK